MKYATYILRSFKDNRRYIGSTKNIQSRLEAHNEGLVEATMNRRPLKLICFKEFGSRAEAMRYEKYLKRLKGGRQLDIEIQKMNKNLPL